MHAATDVAKLRIWPVPYRLEPEYYSGEEDTEVFISESEEEQNDSTASSSTESRQIAEIDFFGLHSGAVWSWRKRSSAFVAKESRFCQG